MSIIGIYVDYKLNYFYVLHLFKIKISMYWLVEIRGDRGYTGRIWEKRCNFLPNKAIESFLAALDSPSFVL